MSAATLWAAAAGAVLLVLAILFGGNPHPHVWWEAVPVYGAIFGYGGAWLLIFVAKRILSPLLRRDLGEGGGTEGES